MPSGRLPDDHQPADLEKPDDRRRGPVLNSQVGKFVLRRVGQTSNRDPYLWSMEGKKLKIRGRIAAGNTLVVEHLEEVL